MHAYHVYHIIQPCIIVSSLYHISLVILPLDVNQSFKSLFVFRLSSFLFPLPLPYDKRTHKHTNTQNPSQTIAIPPQAINQSNAFLHAISHHDTVRRTSCQVLYSYHSSYYSIRFDRISYDTIKRNHQPLSYHDWSNAHPIAYHLSSADSLISYHNFDSSFNSLLSIAHIMQLCQY